VRSALSWKARTHFIIKGHPYWGCNQCKLFKPRLQPHHARLQLQPHHARLQLQPHHARLQLQLHHAMTCRCSDVACAQQILSSASCSGGRAMESRCKNAAFAQQVSSSASCSGGRACQVPGGHAGDAVGLPRRRRLPAGRPPLPAGASAPVHSEHMLPGLPASTNEQEEGHRLTESVYLCQVTQIPMVQAEAVHAVLGAPAAASPMRQFPLVRTQWPLVVKFRQGFWPYAASAMLSMPIPAESYQLLPCSRLGCLPWCPHPSSTPRRPFGALLHVLVSRQPTFAAVQWRRAQILDRARRQLASAAGLPARSAADALVAIAFLEHLDTKQVLRVFVKLASPYDPCNSQRPSWSS